VRRRLLLLLALIVAVAAFLAWRPDRSGRAPEGQPPLASLAPEALDTIRGAFNEASDEVRVVALLSPT
jgi:hypothetical protein